MIWPGATGLAEDVRRYGQWMRDEAEKRIGHLYPKVKVGGIKATVIAWIWARTVICPNPACGGTMPLVRSFWLGKKRGKERYVVPIPDGKRVRFEIDGPKRHPHEGTVSGTGAVCLLCSTPVPSPTSAPKARPAAWARSSRPSPPKASASATTSRPPRTTRRLRTSRARTTSPRQNSRTTLRI